jgi:tetratricopeptide (TPR) repeat protein
MNRPSRGIVTFVIAIAALALGVVPGFAQIPDQFTNLKVLPKDISKRELVDVMRSFSHSLGVRCNFCHVGESKTSLEGYDFASDKKEHKRVALAMLKMTQEINDRLLPTTGRKELMQVRCVTCHRGLEEPQTLDNVLLEEISENGLDSAKTRYAELRKEYYGTGSYDFSEETLATVAEELSNDNNVDGAIEILQLNIEQNPDSAQSLLMLGQLYNSKGDKDAAIAAVEKALKLDPENLRAKHMLEQLRPSK